VGEPNSHRFLAGNNCAVRGDPPSSAPMLEGSTIMAKETRWLIQQSDYPTLSR
jgi:hypothetical protein